MTVREALQKMYHLQKMGVSINTSNGQIYRGRPCDAERALDQLSRDYINQYATATETNRTTMEDAAERIEKGEQLLKELAPLTEKGPYVRFVRIAYTEIEGEIVSDRRRARRSNRLFTRHEGLLNTWIDFLDRNVLEITNGDHEYILKCSGIEGGTECGN